MSLDPLLVLFVVLEVADQPRRERLGLALAELGNLLVNLALNQVFLLILSGRLLFAL